MENDLISIIVPVYNAEKYLVECLDSLINQRYKNVEILCINDGSTDNSRSIIDDYRAKDSRIKLLEHDISCSNKGLSASRNLGIKEAAGNYICFIDSDDFINEEFIIDLYIDIKKTNSDIAMASIYKTYTSYQEPLVVYNQNIIVTKTKDKFDLAKLPKHNYVCNKLYKAAFLKKSGILFREYRLYEDIEWTHKVLYLANKVCASTFAKYFYRQHNSSIVAIKSKKWLEDRDLAWKNTIRFAQSIPTNVGNMRDYDWSEMIDYVVFGILLLRIRICGFYKLYYLFGKILIFEVRRKAKDYKEGD